MGITKNILAAFQLIHDNFHQSKNFWKALHNKALVIYDVFNLEVGRFGLGSCLGIKRYCSRCFKSLWILMEIEVSDEHL